MYFQVYIYVAALASSSSQAGQTEACLGVTTHFEHNIKLNASGTSEISLHL